MNDSNSAPSALEKQSDVPASLVAALDVAGVFLSRQQYAEAAAICTEALAVNAGTDASSLVPLHEVHIRALYSQGRVIEALRAYRAVARSLTVGEDPEFEEIYYEALKATASPPVPFRRRDRYRKLIETLYSTIHLTGDVVECGCFMGLSSYLMCRYLQLADESYVGGGFHVFDSFEGLSEPTGPDLRFEDTDDVAGLSAMSRPGAFAAPLDHLRRALTPFPAVEIHPGWLPASLEDQPERQYRFVHVDVDLFEPTKGALEYFVPRLVRGGCIVSDDFRWPGARQAISTFADLNGLPLEVNAMGQATIRKL